MQSDPYSPGGGDQWGNVDLGGQQPMGGSGGQAPAPQMGGMQMGQQQSYQPPQMSAQTAASFGMPAGSGQQPQSGMGGAMQQQPPSPWQSQGGQQPMHGDPYGMRPQQHPPQGHGYAQPMHNTGYDTPPKRDPGFGGQQGGPQTPLQTAYGPPPKRPQQQSQGMTQQRQPQQDRGY